MALRGTLKDYGIADILQLIGHQGKSGVLTVRNGSEEVQIHFLEGNVVHAEPGARAKRDLLGRMLVRAEAVSEDQLNRALEEQKRTHVRLGQILVETGVLQREALSTFTRLQTTETLYRLFVWSSGTYEFTQKDVEAQSEFEPIKSETILMEGFRQLDEWPGIRRRITGYGVCFDRLEDLDALLANAPASEDGGFDEPFSDELDLADSGRPSRLRNIGQTERLVYQLIRNDRDVQKIIDLSRLGEFEACKALSALIEAGIIRPTEAATKRTPSAEATVGAIGVRERYLTGLLMRASAVVALVGGLAIGLDYVGATQVAAFIRHPEWGFADTSLNNELCVGQMQRIESALELFRARFGAYPEHLEELVTARLLSSRDTTFPWRRPYYYARTGERYELLRPLR